MNEHFIVNFEQVSLPEPTEKKVRGKDYVGYGEDNKYPEFLKKIYDDCADHQSIVDGMVSFTVGNGITSTNAKLQKFFEGVNSDETIDDLCRKIMLDYYIFGGFCLDVIPNMARELSQMRYVDFMTARVDESEENIYISKDWGKWGAQALVYHNFKKGNIDKRQMFYFKGHKTRGVYPVPLYNAALRSLYTAIEITKFHLNNISNGFQVNTIVNMNNGIPQKEVREDIERDINAKFSGTSGSKLMVVFNESRDKGTEIQKLDADNFDEKFQALQKNAQQSIFTAWRVTSPALFGIKMENTGFSKTEYFEAFEIFTKTVVKSQQDILISELTKLFEPYFGKGLGISINPFNIVDNGQV